MESQNKINTINELFEEFKVNENKLNAIFNNKPRFEMASPQNVTLAKPQHPGFQFLRVFLFFMITTFPPVILFLQFFPEKYDLGKTAEMLLYINITISIWSLINETIKYFNDTKKFKFEKNRFREESLKFKDSKADFSKKEILYEFKNNRIRDELKKRNKQITSEINILYNDLKQNNGVDKTVIDRLSIKLNGLLYYDYTIKKIENIIKPEIAENIKIELFCPNCGYKFRHKIKLIGKGGGIISGALTGASIGAKFGIAGGPLGAIAGTIPGAVLGAIFGKNLGNNFDKPICPKCRTKFDIPAKL